MNAVDLSRYRFDFDLTFSAMTMNADGTTYHRYGGRPPKSADGWLSMGSFAKVLERSLETHRRYSAKPEPPKIAARRTIRDLEPYNTEKLKAKPADCVHCHMVHTALRVEKRAAGEWKSRDIWIWPPPERIGLTIDAGDQQTIVAVGSGSAASKAGLGIGERVLRIGEQPIASITDVQAALDPLPWNGGRLMIETQRAGKPRTVAVELTRGWREGTPRSFAWRAYKWGLQPSPGFGGPDLAAEELAALGLAKGTHAFRISYLVTWGVNANLGRNAARAGLKRGDVVLKVAGTRFDSCAHFHAWFRLTRTRGEHLPVEVLRRGKRKTLSLEVIASREY